MLFGESILIDGVPASSSVSSRSASAGLIRRPSAPPSRYQGGPNPWQMRGTDHEQGGQQSGHASCRQPDEPERFVPEMITKKDIMYK